MSAIAGIIRWDGRPVPQAHIDGMMAVVSHRGPDGIRTEVAGHVALGHGLLALEKREMESSQPVWLPNRSAGIVAEMTSLLGVHPRWLAYEWPPERRATGKGRGQVHRWFLFRLEGGEAAIDLAGAESTEFVAWRWTTLRELAAETVAFRQPVYRELAEHFAPHLAPR